MESFSAQLFKRARWLVKIRWIACFLVSGLILFVTEILHFQLPLLPLIILIVLLALYNALLAFLLHKIPPSNWPKRAVELLRWQFSVDFILLALFLHYSGGIENPFAVYFIFHVVLSSILLDRFYAYIQTILGVLLFLTIVLLEYLNIIPHYSIFIYDQGGIYQSPLHVLAIVFALISALCFSALFASAVAIKLRQRDQELQEAYAMLKEEDLRKSEYVMMISHDLKEPIATVQNCIQLVLGGYCGNVSSPAEKTLKRATKWIDKMIQLTHDLLSLSHIKVMPPIVLKILNLKREIQEIMKEHEKIFKDKSQKIEMSLASDEIPIRGDREIFTHIFTNLITNAIKYTPPKGTIGVNLFTEGERVILEVWDTGIGIAAEYQENIFKDFFRAPDAVRHDPDGTGLGLAIVKQGVERLNGVISVISPYQGKQPRTCGTCFHLAFPAVLEEEANS